MSSQLQATLEGSYYKDPAILEQELECIFSASWLLAGREDQAARVGDYFTFELGAESLLIVRGRDGILRAFYNVCRHRGSRLCLPGKGHLKGAIQCPYHAWSYALDGSLRSAPSLHESEHFAKEDHSLYPAAVEVWQGFVFIRLDRDGITLPAQLGSLPERSSPYPLESLRVGARAEREVGANWKILIENFMECYHCPGIHPELTNLVPLYGSGEVDKSNAEPPEYREGVVTATLDGTTLRPIFAGLRDRKRQRYHADLVLPNLFLYLFPDYVCARSLWPVSPTKTRIVSEWLFEPEVLQQPDCNVNDAVSFMNLLGEQDWRVCEGVQQGIVSRAHAHGVLLEQESEVADFKRWYLQRLQSRH